MRGGIAFCSSVQGYVAPSTVDKELWRRLLTSRLRHAGALSGLHAVRRRRRQMSARAGVRVCACARAGWGWLERAFSHGLVCLRVGGRCGARWEISGYTSALRTCGSQNLWDG